MLHRLLLPAVLLLTSSQALANAMTPPAATPLPGPYPTARTEDTRIERFGLSVPDPYRWLEHDVRNDPSVRAWVDAENALTRQVLDGLPGRARIDRTLRALWNFERWTVPEQRGGRTFFRRNSGLQNQSVLEVSDATGSRALIDPNPWAADGATALAESAPSEDGHWLAYAVQDGGTDWRTVRFRAVATGQDAPDELHWVKFSGLNWATDGSGIYYSRFPEPPPGTEFQSLNTHQSVYFHRLGTPQSEDRLVYATPDRPSLGHGASVTEDGRWLVITTYEGTDDRYEVGVKNLRTDGQVQILFAGLTHHWSLVGAVGDTLYFITNLDAPRYRIVAVDLSTADRRPHEVVAEGAGTVASASLAGGYLLVHTLVDAHSVVTRYDLDGRHPRPIALPGLGSADGFDGRRHDAYVYYGFSSYTQPETIYRLNVKTLASTVYRAPKVTFDPAAYEVRQEFYRSKDGTTVPIFVVGRKDRGAGPHPTVLYGYGGFNISLTPAYSPAIMAWLDLGGTYAVANLRGGGEYGKAWHDGGRLLNKQNVFDDCIAAAEHLIATGRTSTAQLALLGGSNGGLLVGAVVNQRPDLFAAAVPEVGVMDMLRYPEFTAGRYWIDDYGNPAEEVHFRNLLGYSPYHNLKAGARYPALLVTTADTDDRVVPGHSFKYAARMQALDLGPNPRLIRIESRAGHGSGKPTDKRIAEYTDVWAFIAGHTGLRLDP